MEVERHHGIQECLQLPGLIAPWDFTIVQASCMQPQEAPSAEEQLPQQAEEQPQQRAEEQPQQQAQAPAQPPPQQKRQQSAGNIGLERSMSLRKIDPLQFVKSPMPLLSADRKKAPERALGKLEDAAARDETCVWQRVRNQCFLGF